MTCSHCRENGHNIRTCPRRNNNITNINRSLNIVSNRSAIIQKWKKSIREIQIIQRFFKCCFIYINHDRVDIRIVYLSWLKFKQINGRLLSNLNHGIDIPIGYSWSNTWGWDGWFAHHFINSRIICHECMIFNSGINPPTDPVRNGLFNMELLNLHNQNYLVYWVVGNYLIQDLDSQTNNINYLGMIHKLGKFLIKTMKGHRFYIVPHRIDKEPAYHPQTDKEFFIEPFCQINIHEKTEEKIYIDDKDSISEINRWKFNALKLDYLIKEVIKLGGKNNDVLESVLDLHQDIKLDSVTENEKDMAGIPSTLTNIT